MTLVQRGRGGWVSRGGAIAGCVAIALCVTFAVVACSSKKNQSGTAAEGANPLGESAVGGEGSLKQFQQGSLGGGAQGPLTDIHFAYNEYTIEQQDGSILHTNATWLSGHPQSRVQVEGHCDERGSEEYNIALGAKRAQAAKDYLETLGISADRISTISYGKELPLCTEHDESCWSQNRRDHFVVSQ